MTVTADLMDFMRWWEGRGGLPALVAYRDGGGTPTLGFGHTADVKMGDTCTPAQADQWLTDEVDEFSAVVDKCVNVQIEQCQHDALTSFTYNEGANAFRGSHLLTMINDGDAETAANTWFPQWVYVGAVKDGGLKNRRAAELRMYDYGVYSGRP
jgi:lysozyme